MEAQRHRAGSTRKSGGAKRNDANADEELAAINVITATIIASAIEVHRELGPGLLESIYERALSIEFDERAIVHTRQLSVPAYYKGQLLGDYRVDLMVEDLVLVEIKSLERWNPLFVAQMMTYLRLTGKRVGLVVN